MITGILLAAGAARRFGGDKLMAQLPVGGCVAAAAAGNLAAGVDRVIAVVRPGNEALSKTLATAGCEVHVFADADAGMGASLAFGVRAAAGADGWLIALADMPWIRPETIRRVSECLRGGALICAPVHGDQRGHPVGFAAGLEDELAVLGDDTGAREVVRRHQGALETLPVIDPGVLADIDTPSDLTRVMAARSGPRRVGRAGDGGE
jgi:molybdenum cofactor cytidylyltransferase